MAWWKRMGAAGLLGLMVLACAPAWADDDGAKRWLPWRWGKSGDHDGGRGGDGEAHRYGGEGGSSGGGIWGLAEPPAYAKECGSCHIAYPAGLLPAGSWQHLMGNLSQHFGSDASLDAATAQTLTQYLMSHAGTYKRVSEMPPEDRITRSYWFARKHDRHVSADVWARPAVGSRSNCGACHPDAQAGNFNEHSVRIP